MSAKDKSLEQCSSPTDIEKFLNKVATTTVRKPEGDRGRLIFALDATASREPTWDRACHIQGQMFEQTAALGGLDIQLCYYRGYGEFNASPWLSDAQKLLTRMTRVYCLGGRTQIEKLLNHALRETKKKRVNALVFVGDCMEESVDRLSELAGELGILGVPAFIFHEGFDPTAERAFQHIAGLTQGACCRFDSGSAEQLKDLLSAVAVYAAGGHRALEDFSRGRSGIIKQLTYKVNK
jgi:hypothetical protein